MVTIRQGFNRRSYELRSINIADGYIGENTRKVYDSIEYCKLENKTGLIIILDFAKALILFDTIKWHLFVREVLYFFKLW